MSLVALYLANGLPDPVEEFRFDPSRRWRFDLCWPEYKVGVELQGGTWTSGRHTRGKGYEDDCEKLNEAQILGWDVLYVTTEMANDGRGRSIIERALRARGYKG